MRNLHTQTPGVWLSRIPYFLFWRLIYEKGQNQAFSEMLLVMNKSERYDSNDH
jgi:hypothetical protein